MRFLRFLFRWGSFTAGSATYPLPVVKIAATVPVATITVASMPVVKVTPTVPVMGTID